MEKESTLTGEVGRVSVLLVQPWIHDFAAFDLWYRPLALLRIARLLRESEISVRVVDLLDRYDPDHAAPSARGPLAQFGCGQYHSVVINKPPVYRSIPRRYRQYGMPEERLRFRLGRMSQPDLVGVTSGMTYWYPGVIRTIEAIRSQWPTVPVVLGGTYARLLPDHARKHSGADDICESVSHVESAAYLAQNVGVDAVSPTDDDLLPDYGFLPPRDAFATVTSVGCCFSCPYCAANHLTGGYRRRTPNSVTSELSQYVNEYGATDVAFYDDALLLNAEDHLLPILRQFEESRLRFHAPNGLHARLVRPAVAEALRRAGFQTVRLGLEVSGAMQDRFGGKVSDEDIERAAFVLVRAGYNRYDIEVYAMMGLPGQSPLDVVEAMLFVQRQKLTLRLNEFSPIPGTPLFRQAMEESGLDLDEPLLQNNTTYSFMHKRFQTCYQPLKDLLHLLNELSRQDRTIDDECRAAQRARRLIRDIARLS